jgi:hypothetical protein
MGSRLLRHSVPCNDPSSTSTERLRQGMSRFETETITDPETNTDPEINSGQGSG